ncbi:MAG: methyl-accepting chemotaxis protein [Pseudomonadota bacterium]|jgi:methyl-accepting chemotaxis protein
MFQNLKVGVRLGLGFAAVLVLLAAVSATSLSRLSALRADLTAVTGEDADRLLLANGMRDLARYQAVALRDAVMQDDPAFKKKELAFIKKARTDYEEKAKTLAGMAQSEELVAALQAADKAFAAVKVPVETAIDRSLSDDMSGAADAVRELVRPAQLAHVTTLDGLVDVVQQASRARALKAEASYQQAAWVIVALTAAALVAGALIAWRIQRGICVPLAHAAQVAQAVADGDLTRTITTDSRDEVGQVVMALQAVNLKLGQALSQVRMAAETMQVASSEIAIGNADLSQRTEHQASNLQQAASAMDELNATVKNNAESARVAEQFASSASAAASRGGEVVNQVVATMSSISASSKKIADIIGTIDGIAFQTNILALNAAVEAARAGEQGRGFAVVAAEVRSLAQRSATAAREIKALIGSSVETVDAGTRLVGDAGTTMTDIVAQTKRVSDLIGEISNASHEQTSGISQVSDAVTQLDQVTQQNAALVEQSAAAADSLKQQAAQLVQAVSVFRTTGDSATFGV